VQCPTILRSTCSVCWQWKAGLKGTAKYWSCLHLYVIHATL